MTTTTDEKIYCYAEHTRRAGAVYLGDDPETEGDDVQLAYEGTREKIIAEARDRLATRYDTRPGGAGDAHDHRVARSVLQHLGAEAYADEDAATYDIAVTEVGGHTWHTTGSEIKAAAIAASLGQLLEVVTITERGEDEPCYQWFLDLKGNLRCTKFGPY